MNFASHNGNLFEVIELEKFEISEERIGPEVCCGNEDEIKIHSAFICLKCNRKVRTRHYFR